MNQTYIVEGMKVQSGLWYAVGKICHGKLYYGTSGKPKGNWRGGMGVSGEIGQDTKFGTNWSEYVSR